MNFRNSRKRPIILFLSYFERELLFCRNPSDERTDPELHGEAGGGNGLCQEGPQVRHQVLRLLARLRTCQSLGEEVRRGHQGMSKKYEILPGEKNVSISCKEEDEFAKFITERVKSHPFENI